MGLFSSIAKGVKKAAGKFVEGFGKLVHNERIQEVGRRWQGKAEEAIQEAASKIQEVGPYEAYSAKNSVEDATKIIKILDGFTSQFEGMAEELEQEIIDDCKEAFNQMEEALHDAGLETAFLKRKIQEIETTVRSSIINALRPKLVLANRKCAEILRIDDDYQRRKEMEAFCTGIICHSIDKLKKNIDAVFEGIMNEIESAIKQREEEEKTKLESLINDLNNLIEQHNANQFNQEKCVLEPSKALCETYCVRALWD